MEVVERASPQAVALVVNCWGACCHRLPAKSRLELRGSDVACHDCDGLPSLVLPKVNAHAAPEAFLRERKGEQPTPKELSSVRGSPPITSTAQGSRGAYAASRAPNGTAASARVSQRGLPEPLPTAFSAGTHHASDGSEEELPRRAMHSVAHVQPEPERGEWTGLVPLLRSPPAAPQSPRMPPTEERSLSPRGLMKCRRCWDCRRKVGLCHLTLKPLVARSLITKHLRERVGPCVDDASGASR